MNLEPDDFLSKRHQERVNEAYRDMLKALGMQTGKSMMTTAFIFREFNLPYRTPFEQAAYDLQYTPKNHVSGPELGATATIDETTADKQYIFIVVCLTLFVILLLLA